MEQKQDVFQIRENDNAQAQAMSLQSRPPMPCKGDIDDFIYGNDDYTVSQR